MKLETYCVLREMYNTGCGLRAAYCLRLTTGCVLLTAECLLPAAWMGNAMTLERKILWYMIFLLIPLGFSTQIYHGPLQGWIKGYVGDGFYAMALYFGLRLLWRNGSISLCALLIFLFCLIIETSQLEFIRISLLQTLRTHSLGVALVGSGFSWLDILHYGIGVVLAVGIEHTTNRCLAQRGIRQPAIR